MTRKELQSLILKKMDELDRWQEHPDAEKIIAGEQAIVYEVADMMARAGFHRLHTIGLALHVDEASEAVKNFLSRCLKALRSKRRAGPKPADSEPEILTSPQAADAPLTVVDVARRLGVSRRVAYELCQDGEINVFKIGRAIRVQPEELAAYIERRTDRGPDALAAHRANGRPSTARPR
jgi:excisionase family DNA binding protein